MPAYFDSTHHRVDLRMQVDSPNRGFRLGQWGALHAVLSHTSVHDEPAIVCLPTGYGKTAVMMALPFLLRSRRVLIVEPTNPLRKQVSSHFQELSTLRRIGVISPEDIASPRVLRHKERCKSVAEWSELEQYDVVVSTPSCSSPVLAPGAERSLFDLIIFDEAHHAPADTWSAYLDHYSTHSIFVFLTATPFRRDRKAIPGKLVYRYSIARAVREGAFMPLDFKPATVANALDDQQVDRAIAEAAVAQLRVDREAGFDHRLMARAETIARARELVPLYEQLGLRVEAVNSHMSKRAQDAVEQRLRTGEIDGIACVDMFGEGYDFPKLKIAALHAPHRTLVPTIQFVGRFARADAATGRGTLIALVSKIRIAALELLSEGVDLTQMFDAAALQQIESDAIAQAVLERLPVRIQRFSDYDAVSPLTLELYAHVVIANCAEPPDFSLIGETLGRGLRVAKQWLSQDGATTLALTIDENPPDWATAEVLVNVRHDAFLLTYVPQSGLCFIGSTRRMKKIYQGLMTTVCPAGFRYLSYQETSRARAGMSNLKFYAIGLRNTTLNSRAESYRVMTGPQAERTLGAGDSRTYVQGHFFGSGDVGGERETIGASGSSRIWSNKTLSVADFLDWVVRLEARLSGISPLAATHFDVVRSTQTLRRLPDKVIAAIWPKVAFRNNPRMRYRDSQNRQRYAQIADCEFAEFNSRPDQGFLRFTVIGDDFRAAMRFSLSGGPMVVLEGEATDVEVDDGWDEWTALDEWLAASPPIFFAADKSSFEGVNLVAPPLTRAERLAPGDVQDIAWDDCEITVEFLPKDETDRTRQRRAALNGRVTVQEHLEVYLSQQPEIRCLFYDHRTGEAADYVAIFARAGGLVDVGLYHCKGAGGPVSGGRVDDVYELAGQIVKSVYYCDALTLYQHMMDRMDPRHSSPSRFCVGTLADAEELLTRTESGSLNFNIVAVQPGISRQAIDAHLADLMAFGIEYATRGGAASGRWLVSR